MAIARIPVGETLTLSTVRALSNAVRQAVDDSNTGLVILEGEGSCFCRGLSFEELSGDKADRVAAVDAFADCLLTISLAAKPTLALVTGTAQGGGVGLAAACDVVLASEDASFNLPELLLGLMPATILPVLLARMTRQQVRLWAMQGATYSAQTAHALGLVDDVVAPNDLAGACTRWERALGRANRRAVGSFKRLLLGEIGEQATAIGRGAALTAAALTDDAVVEPLRAFWLDGTPPWEGR